MSKATQDLTGQWEFREYPLAVRRMRDLDGDDWKKTMVPGSVFSSLAEAGVIDSVLPGSNPEEFGWVSEKPWVYRKKFDLSPDFST